MTVRGTMPFTMVCVATSISGASPRTGYETPWEYASFLGMLRAPPQRFMRRLRERAVDNPVSVGVSGHLDDVIDGRCGVRLQPADPFDGPQGCFDGHRSVAVDDAHASQSPRGCLACHGLRHKPLNCVSRLLGEPHDASSFPPRRVMEKSASAVRGMDRDCTRYRSFLPA